MKIHPLADRFPMMSKEDLQELADDIKKNGLNEPIVTDETGELVLDGRNRLAACKLAGVKPVFKKLEAGRDHDAYILSANVWRRMLSKGQQAMAVAMAYPELEKGGRGKKSEAKNWAATAQFSTRRVKLAQQVLRHSSSYADAVLAGTITLDAALEKIKKEEQDVSSTEAQLSRLKAEAPELAARVEDEGDKLTLDEAMAIHTQNQARIRQLKDSAQLAADEIKAFIQQVEVIEAGVAVGAQLDFPPDLLNQISKALTTLTELAKAPRRATMSATPSMEQRSADVNRVESK